MANNTDPYYYITNHYNSKTTSNGGNIVYITVPKTTNNAIGWISYGILGNNENNDAPPEEPTIIVQDKVKRGTEEGYECVKCQEFCPMAELNYPENETIKTEFKCYPCRKGLK